MWLGKKSKVGTWFLAFSAILLGQTYFSCKDKWQMIRFPSSNWIKILVMVGCFMYGKSGSFYMSFKKVYATKVNKRGLKLYVDYEAI